MPLNPKISAALAAGLDLPAYETLPIAEVRRRAKHGYVFAQATGVQSVEDGLIPRRNGDIRIRIYRPFGEVVRPAVIFFHGSGFCILDLDTHDEICRSLCIGGNCVVISVDYGLAPEARFPCGIDDSLDAAQWVTQNAAALSIDGARVVLAGDSAGGNMAIVTAMRLRDEGKPAVSGLLLFYPVTDHYDAQHSSYVTFGTAFGLTASTMRWFWDLYLDDDREADSAYVSPVRAASLRGLPSTYIQTAEYDILRDEGEAFARRLEADRVPVQALRAHGLNHGYLRWIGTVAEATTKMAEACDWLRSIWARSEKNPG